MLTAKKGFAKFFGEFFTQVRCTYSIPADNPPSEMIRRPENLEKYHFLKRGPAQNFPKNKKTAKISDPANIFSPETYPLSVATGN